MNDRGDEQTASNAAAATKSQALMQFHATDEDDATRREAPGATAPAIVQSENALQRAFERALEDRMTEALDAGEFVIHLQPKLDLRKGQIAGAEALVRWRDPRVGLRLPGAFLPLFEKTGSSSIWTGSCSNRCALCSMRGRWPACIRFPCRSIFRGRTCST